MRAKHLMEIQALSVDTYDFERKGNDLSAEALRGLRQSPKVLSPKFFYDAEGSRIFEEICNLEEYYVTRSEMALFKAIQTQLSAVLQEDFNLLEYGCGSSDKVRVLLDSHPSCRAYAGIDISKEALWNLTEGIAASYPHLHVMALCGDFLESHEIPWNGTGKFRKVAFFPGSSIGNLRPEEAHLFLRNVAKTVGSRGGLLIGVDLKKDEKILHAAYNDSKGVTARFNKNALRHINRKCDANFQLDQFEHVAFYNEVAGRIEMHLKSLCDQIVNIAGEEINFEAGETIHTENSYKYHPSEFQLLARRAGWRAVRCWVDKAKNFSIHYFELP